MPATPRGPRSPRSEASRPAPRRQLSAATIAGTVIACLVICSLIAGSLGSIWMDRGVTEESAIPLEDTGRDFENEMRTAVAANPEDVVALVSLANLLATRGDDEEATDLYARAIELDPENARYRLEFALSLARIGAAADAEVQYRRVLDADPSDAEAWYFLGELYVRWNPPRIAEAEAAFEQAIVVAPGSVSADQASRALARLESQVGATPVAEETP